MLYYNVPTTINKLKYLNKKKKIMNLGYLYTIISDNLLSTCPLNS